MSHNYKDMNQQLQRDITWVNRMAWLMDDRFRLKGTKFRFGLDPLINLVPFLGDIIGFSISFLLVLVMWRNGASRKVVMLMIINVLIDLTIGAIPVIGNLFDFFFKANKKNVILLNQYYYEDKHQGKGNDVLAVILGIFLTLAVLFVILLYQAFLWFIGLW